MPITRIQLFETYCNKVDSVLVASRIDSAVSTSSQETIVLTDIKNDLVISLENEKTLINIKKFASTTTLDSQIASIDAQITDIQGVV